ncbi:MAG: stage V sporulation protein AB [Clostridiales bacterium]|jgi:stage V sporulation protein AB|nr:stage V sporulation protein AB [Clostridiales bacterium]
MIKELILIFICFSSGLTISSAFAALIVQLKIINKLIFITKTEKFLKLYEIALILGIFFGGISKKIFLDIKLFGILFFLCLGVFHGCLAMLLAEVLNVLPVFLKKINLKKYFNLLILSIALGKLFGCLIYYLVFKFK